MHGNQRLRQSVASQTEQIRRRACTPKRERRRSVEQGGGRQWNRVEAVSGRLSGAAKQQQSAAVAIWGGSEERPPVGSCPDVPRPSPLPSACIAPSHATESTPRARLSGERACVRRTRSLVFGRRAAKTRVWSRRLLFQSTREGRGFGSSRRYAARGELIKQPAAHAAAKQKRAVELYWEGGGHVGRDHSACPDNDPQGALGTAAAACVRHGSSGERS